MAAVGFPLSHAFLRFKKCSTSTDSLSSPAPLCSWWSSTGLTLIYQCLSCPGGAQTQIQYSRCGLTSDKQQGIIISLKLLTTFLLIQCSVQSVFIAARVCCQLTLPLLFTRTFRSFSAMLLFSQLIPRLYSYSYSFSSTVLWHLFLLNFMSFAVSSFLQPVEIPLNSSHILSSSFLSPAKSVRSMSTSPRKILNSTDCSTIPREAPLLIHHRLDWFFLTCDQTSEPSQLSTNHLSFQLSYNTYYGELCPKSRQS